MTTEITILTDVNQIRELFQPQLDVTPKSSGDYLNGKSLDEAVLSYMAYMASNNPQIPVTREDAIVYLKNRCNLWREHAGQALLYFMDYSNQVNPIQHTDGSRSTTVQMVRIWEDELDSLVGYKVVGPTATVGKFPRLQRI